MALTGGVLRHRPGSLSFVMLLTLACLYSLGFLSASMATLEVGPFFAGATRVITASAFLLVVAYVTGAGLVQGTRLWVMASIYGAISLSIPFLILPWTLTYVSNTTAAIYYAVIPIKVLLLSRIFIGTPITARKWVGFTLASAGIIILALAGVAGDTTILAAPMIQDSFEGELPIWIPHLICIMTAIFIAAGGVLFQMMPPASAVAITASAFLAGSILAFPVALITLPDTMPSLEGMAWILSSGILVSGCGMLVRGQLIQRENAVYTSTNGYIVPLITSLFGITILGESIGAVSVMAYMLVLGGLVLSRR
ncbi:DMT family transporter [Alphaproteobacteria bacterium LSUCC0719]|jgi:probable blue pigment (indigoidine) exporter